MLFKSITFDLTIGISTSLVFQKLEIQIFQETPGSTQLEFGKAFKYASEVEPVKKPRLLMSTSDSAIERSFFQLFNHKTPSNQKKKKKKKLSILEHFARQILSLFLSKFSPKHIQKTFDFSLFSTVKMQCSCTLFPLLGLRILNLRF